jgi:hypothetical protein
MVCLNRERFRLPATIAATIAVLPALAAAQLIFSAPASAHARAHHHHYLARREAAPALAENFAQPAFGGRQDYQRPQPFNGSAATASHRRSTAWRLQPRARPAFRCRWSSA